MASVFLQSQETWGFDEMSFASGNYIYSVATGRFDRDEYLDLLDINIKTAELTVSLGRQIEK